MTTFTGSHKGPGQFPYTVEEFAVALNYVISLEPNSKKLTDEHKKVVFMTAKVEPPVSLNGE